MASRHDSSKDQERGVGRTPMRISGHALVQKLLTVLEIDKWDMYRILEQEEKDANEAFGTYFLL